MWLFFFFFLKLIFVNKIHCITYARVYERTIVIEYTTKRNSRFVTRSRYIRKVRVLLFILHTRNENDVRSRTRAQYLHGYANYNNRKQTGLEKSILLFYYECTYARIESSSTRKSYYFYSGENGPIYNSYLNIDNAKRYETC